MSGVRVHVRFSPASLKTNHAGLDLEASALAYRDALDHALRAAIACDVLEVTIDREAASMRIEIEGATPALAQRLERDVLDHAWVVRQMGAWAVVA